MEYSEVNHFVQKKTFRSGILYPLPDGAYCTLQAVCLWYQEQWPGAKGRDHIGNTETMTQSLEASLHLPPHVFVTHDHVILTEDLQAFLLHPLSILLGYQHSRSDWGHRRHWHVRAVRCLRHSGLWMHA